MKKLLFSLALMLVAGVTGAWADARVMPAYVGQLGLSDNSNSDWGLYCSKSLKIAAGETYVYTFVNYNKGSEATDVWDNWTVEGSDGTNHFDIRADIGWWTNPSTCPYSITHTGNWVTENSRDWKAWMAAYNGVKETLTIFRSTDGGTVSVKHSATLNDGNSTVYAGEFTISNLVTSSDIEITLKNQESHQMINKVVYTNASGNIKAYENYTSYITNPDFEADAAETITPTGWTITGENATGSTNSQDNTGWVESSNWISGSKLYYSGWAAKTISQTLSNLPAGNYTLYAQAGSWFAADNSTNTCWLTVNGVKSKEFSVGESIVDLSQTFTLTEAKDVTIGSDAKWGRRIDNFNLEKNYDLYTVTYDANGGYGTLTDDTKYESGATVTVKGNTFGKSEANFIGWNTKADGNGISYAEKGTFTISENTTLYAQWKNHTIYTNGTIGSTTNTDNTWWTAFSPYTTIKKGETYTFQFTNHGGKENWNNYLLVAANQEGRNSQGYSEYFVLRSDFYGWGANYDKKGLSGNYNYETDETQWGIWKNNMASGKFVTTMNVKFTGTKFVMTSNTTDGTTNYTYDFTSKEFTEAESAVLFFTVDNSHLTDFSSAISAVDVTTMANGWASFTNNTGKAVKLQGDEAKAYVCMSVQGETAMFEPVDEVGDGDAVFVKGDEAKVATYTFETQSYKGDKVEGNLVKPCWYDVNLTSASNAYILATWTKDGSEPVCGLYKVTSNVTLAKGKAYIVPDVTVEAKSLTFGFVDNNATAINSVNNEQLTVNNGKFIQNGQLVIVKNGKQYNAAGAQVK